MGKILRSDGLSELFGLDMGQNGLADAELPGTTATKSKRAKRVRIKEPLNHGRNL